MLTKIKEKYKQWQHQRYLRKMGWTEKMYQRQIDPDCDMQARTVKDYFHGYPHLIVMKSAADWNRRYGSWSEGLRLATEWCEESCQDKFREDILRAFEQNGIDLLGRSHPEWHINELSHDVLVWAFKSEKDYINFLLKWM